MNLRRCILVLYVVLFSLSGRAQLNTDRVMEIGRNALYYEDYVLSIQYFNSVIESKPYLHEPYFFRALAKYNLEDYTGARDDLDVAIERNPFVSRCYQLRGICHACLDSLFLAGRDLRMAIKYDPQNPALWQNLGMVAMQSSDWESAANIVDTLILYSPRSSTSYLLRSQVAVNVGDTLMALELIDKSMQYDSYSSEAYETRAAIYFGQGNYEAAEKDLDKAIEIAPTRAASYLNRALIRYHRNDLRGALKDYDMAVYVDPRNFVAYYNRGLLRMNVGDDNRAIEDFDKVLEIDPDNTMARFNRGLLREAVGDYKGAVADYSFVIKAYPNYEYAYQCRASAYRKAGNKKRAAADEQWLLKRSVDIYNNGLSSVRKKGYSADEDKTRKRSEENISNYNKIVVPDDTYDKKYAAEYRGKVQNRNILVEFEPSYVLTYYVDGGGIGRSGYYIRHMEELNGRLALDNPLLLVCKERSLDGNEIKYHFAHVDELSKNVAGEKCDAVSCMLRAVDFYLLQDVESALLDADKAVALDSLSWEPYFVRSFIRNRRVETEEAAGRDGGKDGMVGKAVLHDKDYRLVKSDLDKVLELVPDFAFAYYNRANVNVGLNDYKAAIVDYTAAIGLNGDFAEAYFNRGLSRIYTGNVREGVSDLSKAGELGMYQAYNVIKRYQFVDGK